MLCKKLLEEAGEVWLAAEHESNDAPAEEISQLAVLDAADDLL